MLCGRASLGYRSVGAQAPLWQRVAAAVGGFLLVTVVSYVVLPSFQEVPADFPAKLLWDFRLASLGTQVVLWTGIGLLFAALMHHDRRRRAAAALPGT